MKLTTTPMKRLILIFLIAMTLPSFAAITERYVKDSATGTGDGTGEINAMSYTDFLDYMITGGSFTAAAGDLFNIKTGSYASRGVNIDAFVNGGSSTSPVIIRGYSTTITDGYQGRTLSGAGPLTTTNMPVWTYTTGALTFSGNHIILESIAVNGARGGNAVSSTGTPTKFVRCVLTNAAFNSTGAVLALGPQGTAVDCDITQTNGGHAGTAGIVMGNSSSRVFHCRIKSTSNGINSNNVGGIIVGNLIYECGGIGLAVTIGTSHTMIIGNTIVSNTGDGIDFANTPNVISVIGNNMITDNGGYGIDFNTAAVGSLTYHNRFRDNTSGSINSGTDWAAATGYGNVDSGAIGDQSTDYVNAAIDDYRLVSGSPATNAGLPGLASIGALQRDQTGGGGEVSSTFVD